jgi:fructose-specific component phosphotransferase system IIB-like protein
MVAATVSDAQLLSVVADMNKAGSMSVIAGSAAPIDVSLNGSNTVLTAFLTCANIQAPNLGGGTNPFSTSPANQ